MGQSPPALVARSQHPECTLVSAMFPVSCAALLLATKDVQNRYSHACQLAPEYDHSSAYKARHRGTILEKYSGRASTKGCSVQRHLRSDGPVLCLHSDSND